MRKDIGETTVKTNAAEGIIVSHLLHPTSHFDHPNDVLRAAHLSEQEKRAILASWASDEYAVESIPALRHYPGTPGAVTLADVMAALRSLDADESEEFETPPNGQSNKRLDLRCFIPIRRRHRAHGVRA